MILVLLGTNPYPFNRLLHAVNEIASQTEEQVIVQSGNTPPLAGRMECHSFVDHAKLKRWIEAAEVVVCQGGYGSLSDCIGKGARIVAVPRSIDYGECVDDQNELVGALAEEGLVVPVYEITELRSAIDLAKQMEVKRVSGSKLPEHLSETIKNLICEN